MLMNALMNGDQAMMKALSSWYYRYLI
jgi:hypothetical protein